MAGRKTRRASFHSPSAPGFGISSRVMASTSPEEGAKEGFPDDPFWGFSLATYDRPGVAAACLGLQDRHGIDVNMVLFCCWAGSLGVEFDGPALSRLVAAAERWQQAVVRPLSEVRRSLKDMVVEGIPTEAREAVRNIVKSAELRAEKQEQVMLAGLLGEGTREQPGRPAASRNFERYCSIAGVAEVREVDEIWTVIVAAAFAEESLENLT